MGASDWTPQKPFDLRERLFEFVCLVVRVVQFLHTRGPVASALSYQLLRSGTSAGANYEEADDGSSDRDTAAEKDRASWAQRDKVSLACLATLRVSHTRPGSCHPGVGRAHQDSRHIAS